MVYEKIYTKEKTKKFNFFAQKKERNRVFVCAPFFILFHVIVVALP
jgi:hypothetical protein